MTRIFGRDPELGYVWLSEPSVERSTGPERTASVGKHNPEPYTPRPFLGFAPPPAPELCAPCQDGDHHFHLPGGRCSLAYCDCPPIRPLGVDQLGLVDAFMDEWKRTPQGCIESAVRALKASAW